MLVTFNHVFFRYVEKEILKDVSFTIHENDKIGIVGANGSGKSTLLKAIIGEIDIEIGQIFQKNGLKIAYLSQEPIFDDQKTILEVAIEKANVENEYEIKAMLSKLGLDQFSTRIVNLSGGEKRRLALAITLAQECDLLILDEPTNHLDIWMINWLEKRLIKWNKALLLVTHDRYFLERITNKTLDIELGNVYVYDANYSNYVKLKAQRMEYQLATNRRLQTILKKEAIWAGLNPQARSTKSKERMQRFYELEHKVKETTQNINDLNQTFSFHSLDTRLGKTTIEIQNLSKTIQDKTLFQHLNYQVQRFDRLGIVGKNGSGKTTLFKILLGEVEEDKGSVVIGQTVKIGYVQQENKILHSPIRIIDYVKQFGEVIDTMDGPLSATQLLENFLFDKNTQYMSVNSLSGGEKRRLQLLTVLMQNPNILLLDEPTNDLDIYTLELLEEYLEKFKGAVLVISHDRYFLDKVTNHYMIFDQGYCKEYTGLISQYITESVSKKKIKQEEERKSGIEIPRFTSKEKKEFDTIEENITQKEEEIALLKQKTFQCGSDYQKILDLQKEINEKEKELEELYERYTYLNQIYDAIEKYKKEKL